MFLLQIHPPQKTFLKVAATPLCHALCSPRHGTAQKTHKTHISTPFSWRILMVHQQAPQLPPLQCKHQSKVSSQRHLTLKGCIHSTLVFINTVSPNNFLDLWLHNFWSFSYRYTSVLLVKQGGPSLADALGESHCSRRASPQREE